VYPTNEVKLFNQYGVLMRKASILGEEDGISLDRPIDAAGVYQEALDSMESLAAQTDPGEATSRSRLATAARALGDVLRDRDPRRALAAYDLAMARLRETRSSLARRRDEAVTLASSAHALRRLGRMAEGRRRIAAAVAILTAVHDLPSTRIPLESDTCAVLREEGDQQADEGRYEMAAQTYERLIAAVDTTGPNPAGDLRDAAALSRLYQGLKEVYRREGAFRQAEATRKRQLDLWQPWTRALPDNPFIARQLAAARAR
jgi:tetratricopeptide (TPR) repeat protein